MLDSKEKPLIATRDALDDIDRVFLEKLRLAVRVIQELGEDPGVLNAALEAELALLKDRIERALLG